MPELVQLEVERWVSGWRDAVSRWGWEPLVRSNGASMDSLVS